MYDNLKQNNTYMTLSMKNDKYKHMHNTVSYSYMEISRLDSTHWMVLGMQVCLNLHMKPHTDFMGAESSAPTF